MWQCSYGSTCSVCSCRCSCTVKSQCLDADDEDRWLLYDAWQCIRVPPQFVNPARIAVAPSVQVTQCVGFDFDLISTTTAIGRAFDGRSTACERSLRSQWRHPLAAMMPTGLFIHAAVLQHGVKWVVEWSLRSRIAGESKSEVES